MIVGCERRGAMRETGDYGRYALYWAPPAGSRLARFGARWFGWDAELRRRVERMELDLPWPLAEINRRSARYGLHATLRSPFRLLPGRTVQALDAAIAGLAAQTAPVRMPPLRLDRTLGFLSLRPTEPSPDLDLLAERCVGALHRFAAPPSEEELARRRAVGLSPRQETMLLRWGYPYVMESFRFHLTLSDRLEEATARTVEAALAPSLSPVLREPCDVGSLCLFGDPGNGPFHLLRRYALAGVAPEAVASIGDGAVR